MIGTAEVLAAIGLTLPGLARVLPWLVPASAAGLMIVMIGATILHVARGEVGSAITTAILLILLTVVAYMRWRVKPIAVRDLYMERWTFDSQGRDEPVNGRADNLYDPVPTDGGERGRNWEGHTRESSVYTHAALHPRASAAVIAAVALGIAAVVGGRRAGTHSLKQS